MRAYQDPGGGISMKCGMTEEPDVLRAEPLFGLRLVQHCRHPQGPQLERVLQLEQLVPGEPRG